MYSTLLHFGLHYQLIFFEQGFYTNISYQQLCLFMGGGGVDSYLDWKKEKLTCVQKYIYSTVYKLYLYVNQCWCILCEYMYTVLIHSHM